MRRTLLCGFGLLLMCVQAHAAPAGVANAHRAAAGSGDADLNNFVLAYLAGFLASCGWLAYRAWRHLRSDVKALRGRA